MDQAVTHLGAAMTAAEFPAWDPPDGRMWQPVNGVTMAMAPTIERHGSIQNEMGRLIGNHLLTQGSPCRCVATPGIVTPVAADQNVQIPGLVVTCARLAAVPTVALPDPILVIGASPGNQAETWINVWTYTLVPSVQEVLVLHSTTVRADLLRRSPDGTWPTVASPVTEGTALPWAASASARRWPASLQTPWTRVFIAAALFRPCQAPLRRPATPLMVGRCSSWQPKRRSRLTRLTTT